MFDVKLEEYPVDILTAHYRVYGELRVRGNPAYYLNDATISALTVHNATLMPIRTGVRVGATPADTLYIPRLEAQIIILGKKPPEETRPLPKAERMVCFTDTYVMRATFYMGVDTQPQDVFQDPNRQYFMATQLEIVTLYQVAAEVKTIAEQAFINGPQIRAFFAPEAESVPA